MLWRPPLITESICKLLLTYQMFVVELAGPYEAQTTLLDWLAVCIVVSDAHRHAHTTGLGAGAPGSGLLVTRG